MSATYKKIFHSFGKEMFGVGRTREELFWFFRECPTFQEARSLAEQGSRYEDFTCQSCDETSFFGVLGYGEGQKEARIEIKKTSGEEYLAMVTHYNIECPITAPLTLCYEQAGWELWTEEMQIAEYYRSLDWAGYPDVICRIYRMFPEFREEIALARKDLHLEQAAGGRVSAEEWIKAE